jgi:hypothetical protein
MEISMENGIASARTDQGGHARSARLQQMMRLPSVPHSPPRVGQTRRADGVTPLEF